MLLGVCLVACCLLHIAGAQFGGMPGMGGMPEPPKVLAVKSDVQYIKCQACEALVKQASCTLRQGLSRALRQCLLLSASSLIVQQTSRANR